jgi:hypothetical protein
LSANRYRASVEHLRIHSLLLETLQLGLEVLLVGLLAERNTGNCVSDFRVERMLVLKILPA